MTPKFTFIFTLLLGCLGGNLLAQKPVLSEPVRFAQAQASTLGLKADDLSEATVSDHYTSRGITHTYLQQQYKGVKVFNALLNIVEAGEIKRVSANRFVSDLAAKTKGQSLSLTAEQAVEAAAKHLEIRPTEKLQIKEQINSPISGNLYQKATFAPANLSREDIPAEVVWVLKDDRVLLCWNVRIYEISGENWWEIRVSAADGAFVEKNNWVQHCQFDLEHPHEHCQHVEGESLHRLQPDHIQQTQAANDYNVFPMPIEAPTFGSRSVINSPWTLAGIGNPAATLGWTNDGSTNYTTTRGNNVWAKDDQASDNETTIGYNPVSPTNDFNYPFTLGGTTAANQDAAITNLFYWNNLCHDIFYQYGFDEPSGNFQKDNIGRGGNGNDFVFADAQDGGGLNNANFSTPPDGSNGRMQMYLWNGFSSLSVSGLGSLANGSASFGPQTFNVTGDLIIANPIQGCSAITNNVVGKIVVIDRGGVGCNFTLKALNAQAAGAIGVILANNQAGGPPSMGGTGPSITIPILSVTQTDGNNIKNAINLGTVNATMIRTNQLDGSFDNGVITHEFGHGISNRLTGGPAASGCLANGEQMGEGWSDYFALMLTTNWATATKNNSRGIGTFASNQIPSGTGIRQYPYSYDMLISPYDYNYARATTQVHAIGTAWCAMLWDMTWNIIDMTPASTDMYAGTGGNNVALNLVMEGLKLQPCGPGFVDGRDAILLADQILYGGAHQCAIWQAFARRGLGYSANQGSNTTTADGSQATDLPPSLTLNASVNTDEIVPNQNFAYTMKVSTNCNAANNFEVRLNLPVGIDYVSGGSYNPGTRVVSFANQNLASNSMQTYVVNVKGGLNGPYPQYIYWDDMETPTANWSASNILQVNFAPSGLYPRSGIAHWAVKDTAVPSAAELISSNTLTVPSTGTPLLSFWHRVNTESNYDGGNVWISDDNGLSWDMVQTGNFVKNGYNSTVSPTDNAVHTNGTPIFSGFLGMRQSAIDISAYQGQNIKVKFLFGTDTGGGGEGWFIDDVQILTGVASLNAGISMYDNTLARLDTQTINLGLRAQPGNCAGFAGTGNTICGTAPTTFSPTGLGTWSGGIGTWTANSYDAAISELGTTLTLSWTIPGGCVDTLSLSLLERPAIPSMINPTVSPTTVCNGTPYTLVASEQPGTQTKWFWFTGAWGVSPTDSLANDSLQLVPTASNSYYAFAQSLTNGCKSEVGREFRINVAPLPTAGLAGPDKTVCAARNTTLGTGSAVSGWTYSWSPALYLNSSTVLKPLLTNLPLGFNQAYVLTVTNQHNCSRKDTVTVNTHNAAALLAATNAGANQTVCSGVPANIGTGGTPGFTYTWAPFAALNNRFAPNPTHLFTNPSSTNANTTNYVLTVRQTSNGCAWKDTVTITTTPLPNPVYVNAGVDKSIPMGGTVSIGGVNAVTGLTYSWTPSTGLNNPNLAKPTASPTTTTTYTLSVRNALGCARTDEMVLTVTGSKFSETASQSLFAVFPNPVSDVLHIHSGDILDGDISILLINDLGQIVLEQNMSLYQQTLEMQIQLDKLSKGVYLLKMLENGNEHSYKVLKQ